MNSPNTGRFPHRSANYSTARRAQLEESLPSVFCRDSRGYDRTFFERHRNAFGSASGVPTAGLRGRFPPRRRDWLLILEAGEIRGAGQMLLGIGLVFLAMGIIRSAGTAAATNRP